MRLGRLWDRRREHEAESDFLELTIEEFETEMEKRSIDMLGMNLHEFKEKAKVEALPDTPAVDHLRFLLGV